MTVAVEPTDLDKMLVDFRAYLVERGYHPDTIAILTRNAEKLALKDWDWEFVRYCLELWRRSKGMTE